MFKRKSIVRLILCLVLTLASFTVLATGVAASETETEYEAMVTKGDVTEYFATVEEAVAYATEDYDRMITLLKDVEIADTLVLTKYGNNIIGNGHTLTYTGTGSAIRIDGTMINLSNFTIKLTAESGAVAIEYTNGNGNGFNVGNVSIEADNNTAYKLTANATTVKIYDGHINAATLVVSDAKNAAFNIGGKITVNCTAAEDSVAAIMILGGKLDVDSMFNNLPLTVDGQQTVYVAPAAAANYPDGADSVLDSIEGLKLAEENQENAAVAVIGEGADLTPYKTLEAAIAAAKADSAKDIITLLCNIETDSVITVDAYVEINGNGFTVTGTANKTFEVYANTIIRNITIVNTSENGRCVDCRKAVYLKLLSGTTLIAANGQTQPLTIGGYDKATTNVTLEGVTIDAGKNGYGVIVFVPANITVGASSGASKKCNISGYAAIYMKEGSAGSTVNVRGASILTGTNSFSGASNDFGTIVLEDGGINVKIHSSAQIIAKATGTAMQALLLINGGSEENTNTIDFVNSGKAVKLIANGDATVFVAGTALESAVVYTRTTATKTAFENAGYTVVDNQVATAPVAAIDECKFALLEDALKIATCKKNETVELLADVTVEEDVVIAETVTLDLNGYVLTANVTANGNVIDSTDGTGKVVGTVTVNAHANGNYLPLYDSEVGGYRLFACEFKIVGVRLSGTKLTYGYRVVFSSAEAYTLFAATCENGSVTASFVVAGSNPEEDSHTFATTTVATFANGAADQLNAGKNVSKALTATFSIAHLVSGDTITGSGAVASDTGVIINTADVVYTVA